MGNFFARRSFLDRGRFLVKASFLSRGSFLREVSSPGAASPPGEAFFSFREASSPGGTPLRFYIYIKV
jgi:hypothetical protein